MSPTPDAGTPQGTPRSNRESPGPEASLELSEGSAPAPAPAPAAEAAHGLGYPAIMELLLYYGADPAAATVGLGASALHSAVALGHAPEASVLLAHRADAAAALSEAGLRLTPLHLATALPTTTLLEALLLELRRLAEIGPSPDLVSQIMEKTQNILRARRAFSGW